MAKHMRDHHPGIVHIHPAAVYYMEQYGPSRLFAAISRSFFQCRMYNDPEYIRMGRLL